MAYRTFENEPYFKAPEINYGNRTLQMLQQAMAMRGRQQQQNRALAANYQADKLASNFTTDQEELNYLTRANTQSAVKDFMNYGSLSAGTRDSLARAQGYKAISDAQWKTKEDLEKAINDRVIRGPKAEKNYFKKDVAQQKIVDAAYGTPEERVTWQDRGDRLKKVANEIGNDYINEFNKDAYVSDYIDELKTQSIRNETTGQSGTSTDKKVTAVFFDKNGVPKVTDEHAIQFLNSSPDIQQRYKQEVDLQLIDDAKKMAATKEGAWVGPLLQKDPALVIQTFRENPSLNTESKMAPGARERELARQDLEAKHRISLDNSYDASKYDPDSARGITSKDFGLEHAFNKNSYGGTGGVFINKKTGTKGIPIKIGRAFDKNDMKVTGNEKSPRTIFVDTYNLLPVDRKTGKPIDLSGGSVDEQIAKMEALPDAAFRDLDLKTVIHGKSYNTADLDQARKEYQQLKLTPEDLMTDDQRKRFGELGATLMELDQNPELAPEIVQAKLGVVVEDLLKPLDRGTTETKEIQGKLGKFDVTDPKNWDEDQKKFAAAFEARRLKATQGGFGTDEKIKATKDNLRKMEQIAGKKKDTTPPRITSQADYDSLPPGAQYLDPQGNVRTKKK